MLLHGIYTLTGRTWVRARYVHTDHKRKAKCARTDHIPEGLYTHREFGDCCRQGSIQDVIWPSVKQGLKSLLPLV